MKPILRFYTAALVLSFTFSIFAANSQTQDWKALNDQLIQKYSLTLRQRSDMPETGVKPNITPGVVTNLSSLKVDFGGGVSGSMYWIKGVLVNLMTMAPGAEIPREILPSERVMIMMKGSMEQLVNGAYTPMVYTEVPSMYYFSTGYVGYKDCLYLPKGAENAVRAGANGAEFIEVYSPVRVDYVAKAGGSAPGGAIPDTGTATPSLLPGSIVNFYDIQLTEIFPGFWARLINGKNFQLSFTECEPNTEVPMHNHPEEQIMITLGGDCRVEVMDSAKPLEERNLVYYPSQMVHGTHNGPKGTAAMDVFWPARVDYMQKQKAQLEKFHAFIPSDVKPVLLIDGTKTTATNSSKKPGLQFTEGPVWINGTLYFSSMFFDIPAGTWKSDPQKSDLVTMKPDGTYSYLISGIQTNGLMPKGNGNIVACDMAGHRIIEVTPSGETLKTLVSIMGDGTRLDGPNDLTIDAKGGIYFTDPQFIFDEKKQPGKTVNYAKPNGQVIRVIEPGQFGMPNGVLLSPDGKTLYVNNTYHNQMNVSDAENWVYAYDVNDDGTISNRRRFAKLFLPFSEYLAGTRSSCADGMKIDDQGNLYVATNIGLQIFDTKGEYIGNIHTPDFPVSCCFGGDDLSTMYMTCWDKVYSVKTLKKGLVYPLKK